MRNSNCVCCPLSSRKKVHTTPGAESLMMILGEAPGQDEESLGKPFSGPTGRLVGWACKEAGIYRPAVTMTNVLLCRPSSSNLNDLEGQDATACCKSGLLREIDDLAKSGLKVILALGSVAAKTLGVTGSIEKIRGSVYDFKTLSGLTIKIIPTLHPGSIMAKHWKRSGGGTASDAVLWLADFRKAHNLTTTEYHTLQENFILKPTMPDVIEFMEDAVRNNRLIAVDTETTGLNPEYAKVVVIGLARSAEDAISIPILTTGGAQYWSEEEWPFVKRAVQQIFDHCSLTFQNCFFDIPMLRANGFPIKGEQVEHDTLALHHTIAPEAKHDLGTIVSLYGKTPYWKAEFKDRKTTILEMDQIEMRRYNLRDCVVLHQVIETMLQDLAELDLLTFYREEVQPLVACILEMKETGVYFSTTAQNRFRSTLEQKITTLESDLYQILSLPQGFNLNSDDHARYLLYALEPTTFKHLADLPKKRPGTQIHAELTALETVRTRGPAYQLTSWKPSSSGTSGKPSVAKEAITALQIQLNNRLSIIKDKPNFESESNEIKTLLSWLVVKQEYDRLQKLLSTYTKFEPSSDKRIRADWKLHGTVSGRLSCTGPALQVIPKVRDNPEDVAAQARNMFVAAPGNVLVSCDYVNLEAQLLAYETLDPQLCNVFSQGLNLHDINTKSMFKIDETSPRWKSARRAAKIFFFGGISYGGGDRTIFEKVWEEAPELNLTFAEFVMAKNSWMRDHPAYVTWKNRIIEQVTLTRTIRTEFGRLRQFIANDKDIGKQALDFKIQSSGASLVNRAMERIRKERTRLGLDAKFVMQVHDQLIMECPKELAEEVKNLMVTEMERPFMYKGVLRHIGVEATIGVSYGEV